MEFYKDALTTLYNADFLTLDLEESSVNLIITSPPYNLNKSYHTLVDDNKGYVDYLNFSAAWLEKSFRLLKPRGRLCLNIPWDTSYGGFQTIGADLTLLAKQLGFKYRPSIIWNKQVNKINGAFGTWLSAAAPFLAAPIELVLIFYKDSWSRTKEAGTSTITKEEFLDYARGVWSITGVHTGKHPAAFPEELPARCIKLFSFVEDVILDPFAGSGTTLVAARRLGRANIGVEISPEFCQLTVERVQTVWPMTASN